MSATTTTRRRGQAIPLVMGFCFLAAVFVFAITTIRVEDKKQNLMTFQQLKAYYMAQGAIQHALLKIRILPNETYDVSALSRGHCPLLIEPPDAPMDPAWDGGLAYLISDINTNSLQIQLTSPETANWSYTVDAAQALTTFMKTGDAEDAGTSMDRRKVNVLELVALGTIQDKHTSNVGGADEKSRTEQVTKIVEISRSSL
jgi:hypothetical protein